MTDTVRTRAHPHPTDTASDGYIHEIVADIARLRPEATAVVHREVSITYGELDRTADRLARHLVALGSGPDARVGVCLERSIESVLVQLAILRTGAAAVLLDPEYPRERLAFMLTDSAAIAVVTRAELVERVDGVTPVVRVEDPRWRSGEPIERCETGVRVSDQTVCHIAYTSGSTGTPKAVLLRHGAMRNTARVLVEQCGIDSDSRGSWLCSPGFGLVEVDAFPILAAGGTLCIPDPAIASSPTELRDWLVRTGITQSLVPTAMAERLWGLDWPAETPLRVMRIAGERVRTWPPERLPFRVLNVYGSAEATVVATIDLGAAARAIGPKRRAELLPPVGKAVANVRMYVLDPSLEPVAPWVTGELYVSGASLSEGYLNRPDANAGKFLPNPIADDPYPVLYRSGDIARTWADGTVEIVGRTDDQVKIRGFLVHLGEVESVLAARPGVRQCAVLAREDVPGERRLVAYVEAAPDDPPSVAVLRRDMVELLPGHMVPAVFVVGDLPTTVNGKIDRAELLPPPRTRPHLEAPYTAPRDAVESALAAIWADVLEIDDIGVHDNFFELGGDSLRATRLLDVLTAALAAGRVGSPGDGAPVEIGMGELFRLPTIAGVAELVADRQGVDREPATATAHEAELVPDPAGRYEPFPLTTGQRARLGAGRALLEWDREWLDVEQIGVAWNTLVARHDALRTVLRADGTQVVVPPSGENAVVVTDLGDLTVDAADREADAIRDRLLAAPMPEPGDALHEFRLALLPDEAVRLLLCVHPVVADAHSVHQVLLPELSELYEDPDAELPEPSLRFRDFAVRTAQADPGRRPSTGLSTEHRAHAFETWQWTALTRAAAAAGTTPAEAVLTTLSGTVAAHGGFALWVAEPVRPRLHPEIDAVVGDFAPAPAPAAGSAVLAVTNLLDHRPVGEATAFGRESRGVFQPSGVAARLLVRVVEGQLLLDWDLCPDDPSLAELPPGAAHRLTTACETAVAQLTATTHPEETGEPA